MMKMVVMVVMLMMVVKMMMITLDLMTHLKYQISSLSKPLKYEYYNDIKPSTLLVPDSLLWIALSLPIHKYYS